MERKRAEDFDQDLLILFDAYVHGDIDRRGFLDKAGRFAVGGVTAGMLLDITLINCVSIIYLLTLLKIWPE